MYKNKFVLNSLLWVIIITLEIIFFIFSANYNFSDAILMVLNRVPSELVIYFSAIYFLFPILFKQKKYFKFFLCLLVVLAVSVIIFKITSYYLQPLPRSEKSLLENLKKWPPTFLEFFFYLRNPIIALSLHYLPKFQENENKKTEAEKLKVLAEMNLLKAQIQPHFLFNSLNNLYSLTLDNSKAAPGYILKLSSIMEYLLYKATKDLVPIKSEIDHIKNYVELEKLKYGDRIEISWDIEKGVLNTEIAPLLLFPFIENAFKHGTSKDVNKTWISISLKKDCKKLVYTVVNSLPNLKKKQTESIEGKGLINLENRLKLIYTNNYKLSFKSDKVTFMSILELQ